MKIVRGGENHFHFISAGDDLIRADSIGFVCLSGDHLIWWIVSDVYSETWTPEIAEEQFVPEADRGREAFEMFKTKSSGRALSQITYGEVPEGFRQVKPEHGTAPRLERGVRYVLHFMGSDVEAFEFEF